MTPKDRGSRRPAAQGLAYFPDTLLQRAHSPSGTEDWQILGNLLSLAGNDGADWALIQVENPAFKSVNLVTWEENGNRKSLQPQKLATERPSNHDVVLATGLNGVVKGTVSGTPSCILLPLSLTYQEVWTIRLDQTLGK